MSLINDVLRDLQTRDAPLRGTQALAGLTPVEGQGDAPARRWLVPAAAALIASSAFALLQRDDDTGKAAVGAMPAAVVAAPATPIARPEPVVHRRLSTLREFSRSLVHRPRRVAPPDRGPGDPAEAKASPAPVLRLSSLPARDPAPAARAVSVATPDRARETVRKEISTTPDDLRRAGVAALNEGRPQLAEEKLRAALERQPELADGWLYLARAVAAQGNDTAAETLLFDALVTVTDTPSVARELARRMLARHANAEALKLLEAYRPTQALDVDHDAFIAAVLQRLGRHARAAQFYRNVLAVRPDSSAWWIGLAISEEALGHREAALDAYRHGRNIGNLDGRLAAYANQRIAAMQGSDPS